MVVELGRKPKRWPRRLLFFFVFLVFEAAAFLTLGSLLFELVDATWARWLAVVGAALVGPLFLSAVIAGRAREKRIGATFRFTLLFLLMLGGGLPWLVAHDATRRAVARNGLWTVEQIAGSRSAETRASWHELFAPDPDPAPAPPPSPGPPPGPGPQGGSAHTPPAPSSGSGGPTR
jgi:low temperature requirement protein LtrA